MTRFICLLAAVAAWPATLAAQGYTHAWYASPYAAPYVSSPGYVVQPTAYAAYAPGSPQETLPAPGDTAASGPAAPPQSAAPCAGPACCETAAGHYVHRSGAFGEYLLWGVSGIDLSFAVPQDGQGAIGSVPQDEVAVLDFDHDSGFRAGFNVALDCYSSVAVTFTQYETNTESALSVAAPDVVLPLVTFPGTFNAGFTSQAVLASYSMNLDTIDLEYRALLISRPCYYVNYSLGLRYAQMEQTFDSVFPFATPDGTTLVGTDIDFTGGGIRAGIEGERRLLKRCGVNLYGKATGTLLGGEFRSFYEQVNQFNGREVLVTWDDDRIVPVAELEAGLSWTSRGDRVRLSAGYYFAIWSNAVTTPEWINAVQSVNFVSVANDSYDDIRFDGLVARIEVRL